MTGDGARRRAPVTVAVVGPADLVDRTMRVAHDKVIDRSCRFLAVPYGHERETVSRLRNIDPAVQAVLFTGPVPQQIARAAGALACPSVAVALTGSALFRSLMRGLLDGHDLTRLSADTLDAAAVEEAYAEIGLPVDGIHRVDLAADEPSEAIAQRHAQLHTQGEVTLALTFLRSVHERLRAWGVPSLRVVPTAQAIRSAAETAVVEATWELVHRARLAFLLVAVDGVQELEARTGLTYAVEERRLDLHAVLLDETRRLQGTLVPLGPGEFLIVTTRGSLETAAGDFTASGLPQRVEERTGLRPSVGLGFGPTAEAARGNARTALHQARQGAAPAGIAVAGDEEGLLLARGYQAPPAGEHDGAGRSLAQLAKLLATMRDEAGNLHLEDRAVDAAEVARLLDMSQSSARRLLRTLADEGLAWPVPAPPASQPGRPRQPYRLAVHRADPHED